MDFSQPVEVEKDSKQYAPADQPTEQPFGDLLAELGRLYSQERTKGQELWQELEALRQQNAELIAQVAAQSQEQSQLAIRLAAADEQIQHLRQTQAQQLAMPLPAEAVPLPETAEGSFAHSGDMVEAGTDIDVPPESKARRENKRLTIENRDLRAQVAALKQQQAGPSEEALQLGEENHQLKKQLGEVEAQVAALHLQLDTAQQQIQEQGSKLEKQGKDLADVKTNLGRTKKSVERAQEDLSAARSENRDLEEVLHVAEYQKQAIQQDFEVVKSARDQLLKQVEDLKVEVQREKEQAGREIARRLTVILTKLSSLAKYDPVPVVGLSERAVLEDLRAELGRAVGGKLEPFPARSEMAGGPLWLDADAIGLESLLRRFDWSPAHPFEGLPAGSRRLAFRVNRWGWAVGDWILLRAQVVPLDQPVDVTPPSLPGDSTSIPASEGETEGETAGPGPDGSPIVPSPDADVLA